MPVEDVLVEDTGRRTRKANAYVTGFGQTRRLVVSDTLLDQASPAEVQTVVAHELGHRRMRHVLLGTLLALVGVTAALLIVWALMGPTVADPHRLPLLLLITLALTVITRPALDALSRRWEQTADRFALGLTHDRTAYEQTFRRLAATNLSDLDPPNSSTSSYSHTRRARRYRGMKPGSNGSSVST